jgi:hypothetical protein
MSLKYLFFAFAFACLAAIPAKGSAAQLLFALEGEQTIRFTVDANPAVARVEVDGFVVSDVDVSINGLAELREVGFVRQLSGGGLIILGTPFDLSGPQLFSGSFAQPTLLTGAFELNALRDPNVTYRLSVTPVGAVPEPGTWILLVTGFGMAAAGLRVRRLRAARPAPAPA